MRGRERIDGVAEVELDSTENHKEGETLVRCWQVVVERTRRLSPSTISLVAIVRIGQVESPRLMKGMNGDGVLIIE